LGADCSTPCFITNINFKRILNMNWEQEKDERDNNCKYCEEICENSFCNSRCKKAYESEN